MSSSSGKPTRTSRRRSATVAGSGATPPQNRAGTRHSATKSGATPPQNSAGTTQSVTAADLEFFKPNQWTLFGWGHQMVQELVMKEGPYRTKLLDLARHSISRLRGQQQHQFTPDGVVAAAWLSVSFLWADPLSEQLSDDASCAYTSMGNTGEEYFPIIALSSAFKENDIPSASGQPMLDPDELTTDHAMALLLFFRKLKHEFLHVVHRFIEIKYKKHFRKGGTPEKYTPNKQNIGRRTAAPEVGDHDEEEDSGGPIRPLYFNQRLSSNNPLCFHIDHKYLPLSALQVLGLLQLSLYYEKVSDESHTSFGGFSPKECRAVVAGFLEPDFYKGKGVSPPVYPGRAAWRRRSESSRSSSPATSMETYDSDDTAELEAWRRMGNVPIQVPEHFFSSG